MELKNGRRDFVKGFGLFSAMFAGVSMARAANSSPTLDGTGVPINNGVIHRETVDPAIISLIEEQAPNSLQLTNTYGEIAPPPPPLNSSFTGMHGSMLVSGGFTSSFLQVNADGAVNIRSTKKQFVPGTENEVSVKMVPGPDGELYLNVNGQWKRILTTS